jgi:multisubunit Na+/H+ antiporter MnhF subunit
VEPGPPIFGPQSPTRFVRLDTILFTMALILLGGLASLPPLLERHKQVILLVIGIVQLLETRIIARFPKRGVSYVVLLKILLATVLSDHTGEVAINSSYYPIYYLPIVTAAFYCGLWMTLFWTLFARRSLLVSLSRHAGIRTDVGGPWLPRTAHHAFLSRANRRQSIVAVQTLRN